MPVLLPPDRVVTAARTVGGAGHVGRNTRSVTFAPWADEPFGHRAAPAVMKRGLKE